MNTIKMAKTQAVFREVNERVRDLNDSAEHLDVADFDECFTCECARQDCIEHVKLSLEAYEEVRRVPTHFVVAPRMSHVFQDVERIFETHSRYWVVEKFGEAELARELAPPSLAPPAGLSRRRKSQLPLHHPAHPFHRGSERSSAGDDTQHNERGRPAGMRLRTGDPTLLDDLRAHFELSGFAVESTGDDALDVRRPDAPSRAQEELEVALHLRVWRAMHPGGRAELTDL